MSDLIFSLKEVTVGGLSTPLFTDLHFELKKGEHWALTGKSGSGKTALLETIAGRLHVAKGEIDHSGFNEIIATLKHNDPLFTWHKLIAYVSSRHHFRNLSNTTNFYYQQRFNSSDSEDAMTVESYLSTAGEELQDSVWTYNKVTERLKLLPLLNKQLIKLSNGETKRLLIAAALLKNPVVLLLDNPLTGLDAGSRHDFNLLLSEVAESGISIVMATSPSEIPGVITHVAVLEDRKIIKREIAATFRSEPFDSYGKDPDFSLLNTLLSGYDKQSYQTVVGMKDVVVRYGDRTILDHVNWNIRTGERWALLGHNGAGKSTLLSLINGDNPQAYANDIVLFDRKRGSGESIWDIKKKIGFVSPELFQYFPATTSCQQVIESGFYDTLGLFRPSDPAKATAALQWMKLLEIEEAARMPFRRVSASTQRLCLLARALVKNPPLLIFDEPCQGLDTHQKEHFKQITDAICDNSNATLIYVSHYQDEIPRSVTYTLKLDMGKVSR